MFDQVSLNGSVGQIAVFLGLTALVALATWLKIRRARHDGSKQDVYLAGRGLSWIFVAGSITLTNLSTEQLVGMNGSQMILVAWWELAGFVGLLTLAFVFVPLYYRYECTTVTEFLEKRYGGASIRTLISGLFIFFNTFVYLPTVLYAGSLFLQSLFGNDLPLIALAIALALVGAAYTVFGGLRAVAVMDTFSGVGILGLALVIVFLALSAVGFDIWNGVPPERMTLVGAKDSPIPFHTLFTGMAFIQIFYWSTNQNITQRAMAAPTVKEARRGVLAAAAIRILVVPPIVVIPGVVAYKLFGDIGDAAYGRLVAEVLPGWLSGAFAAMVAAAVITSYSAVLNSTVALYSVDFHERFIGQVANHWKLGALMSAIVTAVSLLMVPLFTGAQSIINLLQQLNGLTSMPILSAFVAALFFRGMDPRAAVIGVLWGVAFYGTFTFWWQPSGLITWHYIDMMLVTLVTSVLMALVVNRLVFKASATFLGFSLFRGRDVPA